LALAESGLVNSMIDISDGVLGDFGHIAEQSGMGGRICLESLPLSAPFRLCAEKFPEYPYHLSLTGGEDYELCFTASQENREKIVDCVKKCGIEASPVGIVASLPGVSVVRADGTFFSLQNKGFNHFT
jgi:thiamine-monophosphate kinase